MKASNIIKLVLDYQRKDDINTGILEILSTFLTKEEFENFISFKEINLSNFPELNLSYYKFDKLEPILLQKHSLTDYILNKVTIKGNILDLLLSRTYSDKLSVEKISNIYSKLYNLSPISKEIITYTAALISKNNSIKIIFSENINSSYNAVNNTISRIKIDLFNLNREGAQPTF